MKELLAKWLKGKGKAVFFIVLIGLIGDRTFVQKNLNDLQELAEALNRALELEKNSTNNFYQEKVDTFYLENPARYAIIKDRE